jgi:hypothetical protein
MPRDGQELVGNLSDYVTAYRQIKSPPCTKYREAIPSGYS